MAAKWRMVGLAILTVVAGAPYLFAAEPAGLRNLPAAEKPRFNVTDRTWPAEIGQAEICLWKDDALAAISITIDDNWVPDHAWWLETGTTYGLQFTWFVIAGNLGKGAFHGTPADFVKLQQAGHDIQSHSMDHFASGSTLDLETNYRQAIESLERDVPGSRVVTLAYPNGLNAQNDRDLAAKYYIAARGVRGHLNPANQVDYMNVNSLSGMMPLDREHFAGLPNLIELNPRWRANYRGWASIHFHGLDNPKQPTGEVKKRVIEALDYVRERRDAFWVAPFTAVAQYGQQRDTATLITEKVHDHQWLLTLTDRMDDRWFNHPLTIKVRIDNNCTSANAQQGGANLPLRIVSHDAQAYALLDAAPDRGVITLTTR